MDPGLMTDSSGDGMAGAKDVSLSTQLNLKKTMYNGTKPCLDCGLSLDPYTAMRQQHCSNCKNRRDSALVKNGMVG